MSLSKQNQAAEEPDQVRFIREALANVKRAEKFQRIKQTGVTILALAAAIWWAYRKTGPELGLEGTVITIVGLIVAISTAKVMALINKNTKTVLQAIADLQQR